MFEFLKDLFGVPKPVKVIGYTEPEVIFTCDSPLDVGVVGVVAEIEGVKIKGQIQVVESGEEQCRGLWIAPAEVVPLLREVFSYQEKRYDPRYLRRLRVRCQKLEDFQGNTLDLSEKGMRLEGRGDFKMGEVITVTFDLDDSRQTSITARARVCWIAPSARDGWIAMGLEYQDLDRTHQKDSSYFYREFLRRLSGEEEVSVSGN